LILSFNPKTITNENLDLKAAVKEVKSILDQLNINIEDAKDNLTVAKIQQAFHEQTSKTSNIYKIGDKVMLNTLHRQKEYINSKPGHVAKFLPRWDGPCMVTEAHPLFSTYKIEMLNNPNSFPVFHASELK
jgi:hypothetical protein